MYIFNKNGRDERACVAFVSKMYSGIGVEEANDAPGDLLEEEVRMSTDFINFAREKGAGRRIVDIGCGLGRSSKVLAVGCEKYLGIDISPSMVAAAKKFNPGNEFFCRDITQPGFRKDEFDTFYWQACVQNIPPKLLEKALQEVYNATQNGGLGFITVCEHNKMTMWSLTGWIKNYCVVWNQAEFEKRLRENGFKILDLKRILCDMAFTVEVCK